MPRLTEVKGAEDHIKESLENIKNLPSKKKEEFKQIEKRVKEKFKKYDK